MTFNEWIASGRPRKEWFGSPEQAERRKERIRLLHEKTEAGKARRRLQHEIALPGRKCKSIMYSNVHRMLNALKIKKTSRSFQYLGCSPGFLRNHLESLFEPGMTWENMGTVWEIDHIVPLSWWDLKNHPEHLFVASHWTNLRPLWKHINHKKSNRYSE